jgi:hypothetical protein
MRILDRKIVVICGKPQAGKDTVAKILEELTGWTKGTCSDVVYADLAETLHLPEQELREIEKEKIRHLLVAHGNYLTRENPAALLDVLINLCECRIIAGVRRIEELDTIPPHADGGLVIWVERPDQEHIVDNTEIRAGQCDIRILNDGTIEDLKEKLKELL